MKHTDEAVQPVAWRYRTIGKSGKRHGWLYEAHSTDLEKYLKEELLPEHTEIQPLYAHPLKGD